MPDAKFKTNILVKPSGSQIVLVCFVIAATICLIFGFYFLLQSADNAWLPISIGIILYFFVFIGWLISRRDADFKNSYPTTFTDSKGNQITTDTRALLAPDGFKLLEIAFSNMAHREPLPEPSGLINDNGIPIPDSVDAAKKLIDEINRGLKKMVDEVVESVDEIKSSAKKYEQPLIEEPYPGLIASNNIEALHDKQKN